MKAAVQRSIALGGGQSRVHRSSWRERASHRDADRTSCALRPAGGIGREFLTTWLQSKCSSLEEIVPTLKGWVTLLSA